MPIDAVHIAEPARSVVAFGQIAPEILAWLMPYRPGKGQRQAEEDAFLDEALEFRCPCL